MFKIMKNVPCHEKTCFLRAFCIRKKNHVQFQTRVGPASEQGGSDKVLSFEYPYPGKSRGWGVRTPSPLPLDPRMTFVFAT